VPLVAVLPAELRELPSELGKVDAILDDERFLAPFRAGATPARDRPWGIYSGYFRDPDGRGCPTRRGFSVAVR
jgi:hypothetical protein